MSKIVYLIDQPLDERNYERFGIETWFARKWEVEVWDLTPLAYRRVWHDFIHSGRKLSEFHSYFPIASRSDLKYRCSRLDKVEYFIDFTGDTLYSIETRLRLQRMGATRTICATGSIPVGGDTYGKRGLGRKLTTLRSKGLVGSLNFLATAIMVWLAARLTKPGLSVTSGTKSLRSSLAGRCTGEILKAHNLDYDIYLRLRTSIPTPSEEYGVFLDQNICFAPEFISENIPYYSTPERYYPAIRNGLKEISGFLRVSMRIAAHPRVSRHGEYRDHFGGMPVEYGRTAELIRNCRVVVCHYSTAIQFAVLFKKPVIFVTTDDLASSPGAEFIACFASALGKSVLNVERDLSSINWQNELLIDSQKYDGYVKEYIKADGSPDISYMDIVAGHLEKILGKPSVSPERRTRASGG